MSLKHLFPKFRENLPFTENSFQQIKFWSLVTLPVNVTNKQNIIIKFLKSLYLQHTVYMHTYELSFLASDTQQYTPNQDYTLLLQNGNGTKNELWFWPTDDYHPSLFEIIKCLWSSSAFHLHLKFLWKFYKICISVNFVFY